MSNVEGSPKHEGRKEHPFASPFGLRASSFFRHSSFVIRHLSVLRLALMTIILSGTIGRSGLGGQAWASLQYLIGLRELGHEVYYLEDCGDTTFVWDWEKEEWNCELDYPAA